MPTGTSKRCKENKISFHNHTSNVFSAVKKMRNDLDFCDVYLIADHSEIEIPAHKMILAASSPYFNAMFTNFEESNQQKVVIKEISYEILSLIIDYIYTSEILITEENVQDLVSAANLFQLVDIRSAGIDFIKNQLHPTNCLGIQAYAELHSFQDLFNEAKNFILKNFVDVIKSEEFLISSYNEFYEMISSDLLNVPTEALIFECIINWIKYDLKLREQHLVNLIKHIHVYLLPVNYIMRMLEETSVKNSPQCNSMIKEALERVLLKIDPRMRVKDKCKLFRGLPKILLVIGGAWCRSKIEYYDFKEEKWHNMADMTTERYGACTVALNGKIHIIGGSEYRISPNIYDVATDKWTCDAEIWMERINFDVATLGNCIYAIGGHIGVFMLYTNTSLKYDPEIGTWNPIAHMSIKRAYHGVGVINDMIYAVGGHDGNNCLNSVECYNPSTDSWRHVPKMNVRRKALGVGVVNGILYAVGGRCDRHRILSSVEAFDPKINKWKFVARMRNQRWGAAVVTVNNLLYVIGGANTAGELPYAEVYDPDSDIWNRLPSRMNVKRFHHCAVVIDKPK